MRKSSNILARVHSRLVKLPVVFRENVCKECGWSTPTFYRKVRIRDKPDPTNMEILIPALSNAEKDAILKQAEIACQEINVYMKRLIKAKS